MNNQPTPQINREFTILGNLIRDNQLYFEISDRVKPEFFSDLQNQRIYDCIGELARQGRSFSILEINDRYRKKYANESIAFRLTELEPLGYSPISIKDATEILITDYEQAQMEKLAQAILNKSQKNAADFALKFIDKLKNNTAVTQSMHIKDLALQAAEEMQEKIRARELGKQIENIIYSGIPELDNDTGGFNPGEVMVLAAASGMGKSTISRVLVMNMAKNYPCFLFTQEMTPLRIAELIGMSFAEIDSIKVRTADLSPSEFKEYTDGLTEASKLDLEFDLITTLTNAETSIRRWRMKHDKSKPAVVFIDYMQQMTDGKRDKYSNINAVSNGLKQMALRENLFVVNLAQLSRAVIHRGGDYRPMKNDINGSENIIMDADFVILGYRAEYYGFETDDNGDSTKGLLELDIAKFRGGDPKVIKLRFIPEYGKIESWNTPLPQIVDFREGYQRNLHDDNVIAQNTINLPTSSIAEDLYGNDDENPPF